MCRTDENTSPLSPAAPLEVLSSVWRDHSCLIFSPAVRTFRNQEPSCLLVRQGFQLRHHGSQLIGPGFLGLETGNDRRELCNRLAVKQTTQRHLDIESFA